MGRHDLIRYSDLRKTLRKKGFKLVRTKGKHLIYRDENGQQIGLPANLKDDLIGVKARKILGEKDGT